MIKYRLVDVDDGFRTIRIIDLDRDISQKELKINMAQPHQLLLSFTNKFPLLQEIKKNKNWGIRLTTEYLDLGFLWWDMNEKDYAETQITFVSSSFFLAQEPLYNNDTYYSGDLQTLLAGLSNKVTFTSINGSADTKINTGFLNNFEIADEAIRYKDFYTWVDGGLKDDGGILKTNILYGNFKDSKTYFETSGDQRLTPLRFNNFTLSDNPKDLNQIHIDKYKINTRGQNFTLLLPYANPVDGASANTRIQIRSANPSYLNPQFPIVPLTNPTTGEVLYYIRNPFVVSGREKIKDYSIESSSNQEDDAGTQEIDTDITEEILYNQAVNYIIQSTFEDNINLDFISKRVFLAGTIADINFINNIQQLDGSETKIRIKSEFVVRESEFNLEEIVN